MNRINRYLLLCTGFLCMFTVYYILLVPRLPRNLISYASRPLWDTDQRPRLHIHSRLLDLPEGADLRSVCREYGWEERLKAVEVWDAVSSSSFCRRRDRHPAVGGSQDTFSQSGSRHESQMEAASTRAPPQPTGKKDNTDPETNGMLTLYIPRHHTPASDNCSLFNQSILSTELPMLLIRLTELDPIVTKFFIIESAHTFTGIPKPLIMSTALKTNPDFAPFLDKIHYRSIDGRILAEGEDPFTQEIEVRRAMTTFIKEYMPPRIQGEKDSDIAMGPVLLFSDVDELVSRPTAKLLQSCRFPFPLHLGLKDYLYSFEFEAGGIMKGVSSWRAHATHWPDRGEGAAEYYRHGKVSENILADSGWHCSWCFEKIEEFITKAKGYSHTDRLGSRPTALLRPERIQKTICDGLDMFAMLPEAYTWREMASKWKLVPSRSIDDDQLPRLLRKKPNKYRWLFPGGCMREE